MTLNSKRKTIYSEVESISFDHVSVGSLLNTINRLADSYGKDAEIRSKFYPYDASGAKYWAVFATRPETNAEMDKRIAIEEKRSGQGQEVERLKAKIKP